MNKFGGKIIQLLVVLILYFMIYSCRTDLVPKFDYSYLIDKTAINKDEVAIIVDHYNKSKRYEEISAYDFILKNLPNQYLIRFKLTRGNTEVVLDQNINYETLIELQKKGFVLDLQDTIKDLDYLLSDAIINHINNFVINWDAKKFTYNLSFDDYMRASLPYRVNNEALSSCFSRLNIRYPINKLIRQKAYKDTISAFDKKIEQILNYYTKNLNGVNHLNTIEDDQVLSKQGQISDFEDYHIFRLNMLRYQGIPSFSQFIPHRRKLFNRPYTLKLMKEGYVFDSLYYSSAVKVYISSFEKREWRNPFDELLELGIAKKDIPLSLYIPKMKDVTKLVTQARDIDISTSHMHGQLSPDSIIYLCTFSLGEWVPVEYGLIKEGQVSFKNVGTEVLYIMGSFSGGNLDIISKPFFIEPLGEVHFLSIYDSLMESRVSLSASNGKVLSSAVDYVLYKWEGDKWQFVLHIDNQNPTTQLLSSSLYIICPLQEGDFKQHRPFTLENNEIIWW